jgi:hypothetical protein
MTHMSFVIDSIFVLALRQKESTFIRTRICKACSGRRVHVDIIVQFVFTLRFSLYISSNLFFYLKEKDMETNFEMFDVARLENHSSIFVWMHVHKVELFTKPQQ